MGLAMGAMVLAGMGRPAWAQAQAEAPPGGQGARGKAPAQRERARALAELPVLCEEPGARGLVAGKPAFKAPGKHKRLVAPGRQVLVAHKKVRFANTKSVRLRRRRPQVIKLELPRLVHRWKPWVPWTVLGTGAVVTLAGVSLHSAARDSERQFYDEVDMRCTCTGARCPCKRVPDSASKIAVTGRRQEIAATASFIAGGAAIVAGAVMAYLNQPHLVHSKQHGRLVLIPEVTARSATVTASLRF